MLAGQTAAEMLLLLTRFALLDLFRDLVHLVLIELHQRLELALDLHLVVVVIKQLAHQHRLVVVFQLADGRIVLLFLVGGEGLGRPQLELRPVGLLFLDSCFALELLCPQDFNLLENKDLLDVF